MRDEMQDEMQGETRDGTRDEMRDHTGRGDVPDTVVPGDQWDTPPGQEEEAAPPADGVPATRTRWLVRAVVGTMALPLAVAGGFAFGRATTPEPEPVVETRTVTETVTVDPSEQREAELDAREQALDEREDDLDRRSGELDEREADLQAWEDELSATEAEIEAGTIPGDGIWVVGEDIEPGVYRAQGSGDSCYWARLGSLDGTDIITNHFGSANVSVEIHASDSAFETSGCGAWRQR